MNIIKQDDINSGNCTERHISSCYPEWHAFLTEKYPDLPWSEKLYWFYHNLTSYPTCTCGNRTKYTNLKQGYREFCGYACMNRSADVQERKKQTSLRKYGCENAMQCEEVKNRLRLSTLNKYGVDNAFKAESVKRKIRETNRIHLGVDYPMQSRECIDKMLLTRNEQRLDDEILSISKDYVYTMSCPHPDCDKCAEKTYQITSGILYDRKRLGCELCTKLSPVGQYTKNTALEKFIRDILDEHNIEYITNTRSIISPKELDIYIPSKKIAIECNGIYWHSTGRVPTNHHSIKYTMCREKGVQLLNIWEDWIINKRDIVKSIILSKLGIYEQRLYARQCEVRPVVVKDSNKFLNENHIQGKCPSAVRLGLYYGDSLVGVMLFGSKKSSTMNSKQDGWSLLRFCTKLNMQVVGGANKLLTHFIREYQPEYIDSFSSNDISNGRLYEALGFKKGPSNQSYWYINGTKRYHRASFTKDAIVARGWKESKDGWTETEVMNERGYCQIYDSGQTKWVWEI